jgi:hypothetical protein
MFEQSQISESLNGAPPQRRQHGVLSHSASQWFRMSIDFDLFCLIVSLTMPYAVDLSVRRGVGCGVWPSSVSVTLSGAPLWVL